MASFSPDCAKRAAAAEAVKLVAPGMKLGLGTGSTARHFVELLGARAAQGLEVLCVPTSEETREQAAGLGLALTSIDETPELDLAVDGADEFDSALRVVKGGGGALLREKIVAAASRRMVVIADASKHVRALGDFPLPVETARFGLAATRRLIAATAQACGCAGPIEPRLSRSGELFLTDNGNYILDCRFGAMPRPEELARRLSALPGVVEHGLFIGLATAVICAGADGVEIFGRLDAVRQEVAFV